MLTYTAPCVWAEDTLVVPKNWDDSRQCFIVSGTFVLSERSMFIMSSIPHTHEDAAWWRTGTVTVLCPYVSRVLALFPQHISRSLGFSVLLNNNVTHRQQEAAVEPPTPIVMSCARYHQNCFSALREIIYKNTSNMYVSGMFVYKHLT